MKLTYDQIQAVRLREAAGSVTPIAGTISAESLRWVIEKLEAEFWDFQDEEDDEACAAENNFLRAMIKFFSDLADIQEKKP